MRRLIIAILAAATFAGPAAANVITDFFTSFYVLGDSLSDDGNHPGPLWLFATGGSPYQGNWRDGGTFTNGDVWNEPLQKTFRKNGRDADNFAFGAARSSGGNWLFPDLDDQIDKLLDSTSSGDRGENSVVAAWIGGNTVLDAIGEGDAVETAIAAAKKLAKGVKRLARKVGIDEFLVFNLPDLGKIPEYRLFESHNKAEARAAGDAYNAELAKRVRSLERGGLNIIDIDVHSLFGDVFADPKSYGFSDVKLPCVFPNAKLAKKYGQPERCSKSTAKKRLFMDALHPNALAHSIIAELVEDALKAEVRSRRSVSQASLAAATAGPQLVANPLPGSWTLLGGALFVFLAMNGGRRYAAAKGAA